MPKAPTNAEAAPDSEKKSESHSAKPKKSKHHHGGDRSNRRQYVIALNEADGLSFGQRKSARPKTTAVDTPARDARPAADGKHVYALGIDGDLACLDFENGEIMWTKNYIHDFDGHMMSGWGYAESPLVDGDRLICTPGGRKNTDGRARQAHRRFDLELRGARFRLAKEKTARPIRRSSSATAAA